MGKEQTEKSPYKSRFGGGWISPAQFLAENMCDRKSRGTGNGKLQALFWNDPYWLKQFRQQITHASELIEEYSMSSILSGLNHPDAKRIYSLGYKAVLIPLIQKEYNREIINERKRLEALETREPLEEIDVLQKPRSAFSSKGKSKLQKLRELDE